MEKFQSLMEDSFSDDEKLSYLLDCLNDTLAAAIVRESLSIGDTFKTVEVIPYGSMTNHDKFCYKLFIVLQRLAS